MKLAKFLIIALIWTLGVTGGAECDDAKVRACNGGNCGGDGRFQIFVRELVAVGLDGTCHYGPEIQAV